MEAITELGLMEVDESPLKKKGVTYTEDDVPVRTLYVTGLKHQPFSTKKELMECFKAFGEVENINMHDRGEHKWAFVTMKSYQDANLILNKRKLNNRKKIYFVKPADSWHQPTVQKKDPAITANGSSAYVYDENKPSLENLNDDCILHVMSYLNIIDLIRLRGVSQRLDYLLNITAKKFVKFDFDDTNPITELTLMIARDILEFLGPILKELKIDGDDFKRGSYRIMDFIGRYCTSLESLSIEGFQLRKVNLLKLIPVFRNLKRFDAGSTTRITDEISVCFENAQNLQHIAFNGNYDLTGRSLTKLKNLETLSLHNCGSLQSKNFVQALQHHTTLKKLEIERCDKLNSTVNQAIVRDLQHLEELSISNSYNDMTNYADFGKIKSLKRLTVEFHTFTLIDELLKNLVSNNSLEELTYIGAGSVRGETMELIAKLTNLKHLQITYNTIVKDDDIMLLMSLKQLKHLGIPGSNFVTGTAIIKVLKACEELEFLDVSKTHVDEVFVNQVLDILKSSPQRPKLQLVLYSTKVHESMLESEAVKELADRIELSFEIKSMEPAQFYMDDTDDDYDDDFFDDDSDDDFDVDGFNPWDFDINEQWGFYGSDDDKYMLGWGQIDHSDDDDDGAYF